MMTSTIRRPPLNILCVDDEESVVTALTYALEVHGHFVEGVRDGRGAWRRIACDLRFFDLIITDHQMPEISGLVLVERLRTAEFPGKIIVHTGHLALAEQTAYRALKVDYILRKPASLVQLLDVIDSIFVEGAAGEERTG